MRFNHQFEAESLTNILLGVPTRISRYVELIEHHSDILLTEVHLDVAKPITNYLS